MIISAGITLLVHNGVPDVSQLGLDRGQSTAWWVVGHVPMSTAAMHAYRQLDNTS